MYKYIAKRILMMIPVVIGVSLLVFTVLKLAPGDVARIVAGSEADDATVEEIRHELGLDRSYPEQYVRYMLGVVRGDMGESYITGKDVFTEIKGRIPTTFTLAFFGMLVSIVIGIPLGILSATKQYSVLDNFATVFALIGVSMPNFWMGLMFILFFSLWLGWLPSGGDGTIRGFIMPALVNGIGAVANLMRTTRSSMLDVIRQDYIRTARAKGVAERATIWRHAFRNALLPLITISGTTMGALLGGAVAMEKVFVIPGLGTLVQDALNRNDAPLVIGAITLMAFTFMMIMLVVDLLYAAVDPRIRAKYSGGRGRKTQKKEAAGNG